VAIGIGGAIPMGMFPKDFLLKYAGRAKSLQCGCCSAWVPLYSNAAGVITDRLCLMEKGLSTGTVLHHDGSFCAVSAGDHHF